MHETMKNSPKTNTHRKLEKPLAAVVALVHFKWI